MLSKEQTEFLRNQLLEKLPYFPEDKRELIKQQILSMSDEELEELSIQSNMTSKENGEQCIFCLISEGKIPSYKIAENEENIAVLEINPLSKGDSLVIPKNHSDNLSYSSMKFAEEVTEELKKFSPKDIQSQKKEIMGHTVLEIIPIYGNEKERKKASPAELENLQKEILTAKDAAKKENLEEKIKEEQKIKEEKKAEEKPRELPKLKRRMP